jgi:SET domain-containing protein
LKPILIATLGISLEPNGGVGVIAKINLAQGEIISLFTGKDYRKIKISELEKYDQNTKKYLIDHGVKDGKSHYVIPKNWYCLSIAWFLNDGGFKSNIVPYHHNGKEMFRVIRAIKSGEELLIDYKEVEPE